MFSLIHSKAGEHSKSIINNCPKPTVEFCNSMAVVLFSIIYLFVHLFTVHGKRNASSLLNSGHFCVIIYELILLRIHILKIQCNSQMLKLKCMTYEWAFSLKTLGNGRNRSFFSMYLYNTCLSNKAEM